MAVTFDLESIDGIAVGIAHGPLSLDEIKQSVARMWSQVAPTRVLWDLSDARFDLAADEVRELAEFARQVAADRELRVAFLVARDLEFGLLRMFEVFRETEGARTSVFRERDRAIEWLRSNEDRPAAPSRPPQATR